MITKPEFEARLREIRGITDAHLHNLRTALQIIMGHDRVIVTGVVAISHYDLQGGPIVSIAIESTGAPNDKTVGEILDQAAKSMKTTPGATDIDGVPLTQISL